MERVLESVELLKYWLWKLRAFTYEDMTPTIGSIAYTFPDIDIRGSRS
jgi:hypothetical protein